MESAEMAGAFILVAVVLWGVTPVLEKTALGSVDPLTGVLIRSAVTSAVVATLLATSGRLKALGALDLRGVALLAASGVLASLVGQWAYFRALQVGRASQVVPLCATYPLVAALLGILVLKERVTPERLIGILFVIAGIWLIKR